jgi:tetratricopeptide (TPR) repeat protein
MLNYLAESLNDLGNSCENRGIQTLARILYHTATITRPSWSSPWYNLGLQAKYKCEWQISAECNERAAALDPNDEASWWNLGIAATALKDWQLARKAWHGCGIKLDEGSGEVAIPPNTACVRLNPNTTGEVVWGTRIDPARIQIRNVPFPDSNRRYRDILLNDGAPEGTRRSRDQEYPVFNELAVWEESTYSTFQSWLSIEDADDEQQLTDACDQNDIGFEDWSTVRIICAACSRGNPELHHCNESAVGEGLKNYGFGTTSRELLIQVLGEWTRQDAGRSFSEPRLMLLASS